MGEIMPVFQELGDGYPLPIIIDCIFQKSRDVLVDFDTALKRIQNAVIDLRPIIKFDPTT